MYRLPPINSSYMDAQLRSLIAFVGLEALRLIIISVNYQLLVILLS